MCKMTPNFDILQTYITNLANLVILIWGIYVVRLNEIPQDIPEDLAY